MLTTTTMDYRTNFESPKYLLPEIERVSERVEKTLIRLGYQLLAQCAFTSRAAKNQFSA